MPTISWLNVIMLFFFSPKRKMSAFDEKMTELHKLKIEANSHLKKLHGLKLRYKDWFNRKYQTFLNSVKLIQILALNLVPREINNLNHFRQIFEMALRFPRNGTPRDKGPSIMEEFIIFWDEFCDMKVEGDILYTKLNTFCSSITNLRNPKIKREIDRLQCNLNVIFSENFNFTNRNNEKDNLFTYRLSVYDESYHGLVNFLPFIVDFAARICFWIGKLYVEKE